MKNNISSLFGINRTCCVLPMRTSIIMSAKTAASDSYTVSVVQDYEGFFEGFTRRLIANKIRSGQKLIHSHFVVEAGPWRMYNVRWKEDENDPRKLCLDYYSVARNHGTLDSDDPALMVAL